jgi:ABC-type sugar transport system permease subunit
VTARRPWLTFLVGLPIVLLVHLGAFVSHRNREFTAGAIREAHTAATEGGRTVSAPTSSPRYSFLRQRQLVEPGSSRPLGGPTASADDKLLADVATTAERDGEVVALLPDGRVIAALPGDGGVQVALLRPTAPRAPYPFLLVGLALALGAIMTFFLARAGWPGLSVLLVGLALGGQAALWSRPAAVVIAIALAALAYADARGRVARAAASVREHRVAFTFLGPAALGMALLVVVPFVIGCVMGFYDHAQGEWRYVGLKNFRQILSGDGRSLTDPLNFWFTLGITIAWTAINVALHVIIGVTLALALRQPWLRLRGLFRVLLILPWAIPNYITALIWRGMFQQQYGAVNSVLDVFGIEKVSWFSQLATAFTANVTTNTWLGFPFMMVVALGALDSIPKDLYEAAAVDGAGPWKRFVNITLPGLRPALMPAIVLGSVWTFNMFNVIYLVSGGKPGGATDILVTQAYRWAFERGQRYGMAAAYATIIFLILVGWMLVAGRLSRGAKEAT